MSPALSLAVLAYAIGLGSACTIVALRNRSRPPVLTAGAFILQVAVLAQAGLDARALAGGRPRDQLPVHLGYLIASVLIVPLAAASVRLDPGRWGSAALAIGSAVLAVVTIRLQQTIAPG